MKDPQQARSPGSVASGGDVYAGDAPASPSRRRLLIGGAAAGAALMLGSPSVFAAKAGGVPAGAKEIRVGFISPRSGPLFLFGESDPYTLGVVRQVLKKGLTIHGETYKVTILDRDSESDPARATQLAKDLINKDHVHFMLSTSTPATVNPVSDVCEAAGVPGLATDCPLESFYLGRGGKVGQPSPFKWTFDMSFGLSTFYRCYLGMWPQLETNKKVGVLYPNGPDGNAFREGVAPVLEKHGYTIIDPGAYENGTTDFSAQIALFNREDCQIYNGVGLPPDIDTFWREAAQLHFLQKLRIAQMTKAGFFTTQLEPLGALAYNICCNVAWAPVFPYKSPLTGGTSEQLADGYQKASGHSWNGQLGQTLSLFEVAVHVLENAKDPTSHSAIRDVIPQVDMVTTVGRINFKKGPFPNTAGTPQLGAQNLKAPDGSPFRLTKVIVDNTEDHNVPVQRKLVPYHV